MIAIEPTKPRRIELILRQIESLPTLPAVAARLLELTASDDSHARQVVELISSDPALTAKVLSLCRSADKGIRDEILTIDKAVVLLGFSAIRNAVLSVKVFELFSDNPPDVSATERTTPQGDSAGKPFDHPGFWMHSLAVGVLAEKIARAHPGRRDLYPDEAFVCGLLHDIGKPALEMVLPKSFARVVELADFNQGNIAEFERRIIGIDHHTAGKRLAEQWRLPHRLQDCIWLHGASFDTLPKLEHRNLIGLIHFADQLVRRQHVGYSGNHRFAQPIEHWTTQLKLDPPTVDKLIDSLHHDVEARAQTLGLGGAPTRAVFLQSIQRANEELGRVNQTLERRSRAAQQQGRMLDAVTAFHNQAAPGQSIQDVLDLVVESAQQTLGPGFYAMLTPAATHGDEARTWLVSQYNREAQAIQAQYVAAPPNAPNLSELRSDNASGGLGLDMMGLLPWVADYLVEADDLRDVKLLPLACGWGVAAVLMHDRNTLPPWQTMQPLTLAWGNAIGSAQQHDGARRLGEELAEANAALAEAQDKLLQTESLARLGEMAAGAAHEMNNPLAVISGRSQLLTMSLNPDSKEHKAAETIHKESHRLSDLITALHMFADPPRAEREPTDISSLLDDVIRKVSSYDLKQRAEINTTMRVREPMGPVEIDPVMVRRAVTELLVNAVLARPRSAIQIQAMRLQENDELLIQISDDGFGMDSRTLAHAFDPFFSSRPAGRRVGMGLPRARQLAQAHGGSIELQSSPDVGTTAVIRLPLQG